MNNTVCKITPGGGTKPYVFHGLYYFVAYIMNNDLVENHTEQCFRGLLTAIGQVIALF